MRGAAGGTLEDEFRELWDACMRTVWTAPPESLLERVLLLRRLLPRLGGSDGQLYLLDARRKNRELLARLGQVSNDEEALSPHELSFLEWTAWWERGREGPAPKLHDSPFSSFCQTLEWGESGRLEFLRKIQPKGDERFLLLRTWAAEESCRQMAEKERWALVREIAEQQELPFYALLAEHALSPTPEIWARCQYRAYRVERLIGQLPQLGLQGLARWQTEAESWKVQLTGVRRPSRSESQ